MNPVISRLLGIIAAFAAGCGGLWGLVGVTTWVNGRPVICDVQWVLVGVVPFVVAGTIIYWTTNYRPR